MGLPILAKGRGDVVVMDCVPIVVVMVVIRVVECVVLLVEEMDKSDVF